MKLSDEQFEKIKQGQANHSKRFSKLADFNPPDSPPPEEKEEPEDPNGPSKFDQLMRQACSIKTHQLEQQRKKFELLPTFLKAGVYYTQKHEVIRRQEDFQVKLYAYEMIAKDATSEYA